MSLQKDRFGPKQVQTPETILAVAQKSKPRGTLVGSSRFEVFCQDPANDIFVQVDPEGIGNLLGDAWTTIPGIATFELEDGLNDLLTWAFGPRLAPWFGREEIAVFPPNKGGVDSKQR